MCIVTSSHAFKGEPNDFTCYQKVGMNIRSAFRRGGKDYRLMVGAFNVADVEIMAPLSQH